MPLYVVIYIIAYAAAAGSFIWMARRRGIATQGISILMQAGLVGGLVSANLAQWVFGGSAGRTILGGIAGGYVCVWAAKRWIGLRRPTGDLFAVALCVGEAIGRWGCFFGGCCYGKPSTVAWAVYQHGAYRHPTQIYLSLSCLLILALLWAYSRTSPPEDGIFCLQGMLYCTARFAIEFLRVSPAVYGLTIAQWACVGGFTFFAIRFRALARTEGFDALVCAGL